MRSTHSMGQYQAVKTSEALTWACRGIGQIQRHTLCACPCGKRPDPEKGAVVVRGRDEGVVPEGDGHSAACVTVPNAMNGSL